jgi:hypothetical protein
MTELEKWRWAKAIAARSPLCASEAIALLERLTAHYHDQLHRQRRERRQARAGNRQQRRTSP